MKKQFTNIEYKNAKSSTKLPCECYTCGNTFYTEKKWIKQALLGKEKRQIMYCSKKCNSIGQITSIECDFKFCGEKINKRLSEIKKTKNIFCSKSCSAKYNNSNRLVSKITRKKIGIKNTKQKKSRYCISCSNEISNNSHKKYCIKCKKFISNVDLFKKLKIDKSLKLYEQAKSAKDELIKLYFNKKMSLNEIKNEYGIMNNTIHFFLKKFNIKLRSLSESNQLCVFNGKSVPSSPIYKHGWHTTWNNKRVYYRSSYELKYCLELDSKKIDYSMESLRIKYYDTQRKKNRIAIPDFLIENTIVEIKSNYTYDPINMKDKFIEYKKMGYESKLIVEHKEVILL